MKPTVLILLAFTCSAMSSLQASIRPSPPRPSYWDFRGPCAPLIGGSSEDNLFQEAGLESELEALVAAGGNYVRCSMSSRDPGNVWPFARDAATGRYDLDQFNPEYWERFERLIRVADERNIVVQIEVFDRFDYFRGPWRDNPFNPANNRNYTAAESGLADDYPVHPNACSNPFFRTVPALEDNPRVRRYQEQFVRKLLEITFPHDNVLYCISNETKENPSWGAYWADFIHRAADEADTRVYVTEMWDARDLGSDEHRHTWGHPETYDFVDISQVNHQTGQTHWDQLMAFRKLMTETGRPRPLNSVKIYGANSGFYGTTRDAQERFWRDLLAGLAGVRFHRPPSGLGHREIALRNLRAARSLIDQFDLTAAQPEAIEIHARSANEAYGTGAPGLGYVIFFPDGGDVMLRTRTAQPGASFALRWLKIAENRWIPAGAATLDAQSELRLVTPEEEGYWLAVLQQSEP